MTPAERHRTKETLMFTAKTCRPPGFCDATPLLDGASAFARYMAYSVVIVGAYGQLHDSLIPPSSPWSNLHVAFGLLLLCSTTVGVYTNIIRHAPDPARDIRETRQLTRLVYLMLYSLAGLRECANIAVYLWQGGTFDLGWLVVGVRAAGAQPRLSNMESFQIYVMYGVVAIFMIRAEAIVFRERDKRLNRRPAEFTSR